ncbi:carbohydrate ABC transporter permease [Cohnella silvisoli]|uniref:Carbohydrate ABC transporter permease n=1 Tax=Cohnella silvisoli TaxID=2873699 RepID=A0ABV1KU06_9BACL|nr:carbohydrate ABC transporter permease [Cohnella silvisoli]MCD9023229.1 carbohydrate ABC transporter permease [Cohnella silvisoli]
MSTRTALVANANPQGNRQYSRLTALKYVFLGVYALAILYPLFFLLISSLKDNDEIFSNPWGLPIKWGLNVYYQVWTQYEVGRYFFNSLYYSLLSVAITIFICSMASYAIVRMKWKLSKWTLGFFLLGLMVPVHSTLVPLYITASKLGLNYPRITMIVIFVAFAIPFSVFVLAGFIQGIPKEMEESGVIDGCSLPKAFWKIIFPLLAPPLATITIFNFLGSWNDLIFSLIFINDEYYKPIQLGIMRFQGNFSTRYSFLLSAIVIAIVPSVAAYMVLQDKIVSGITAGAVKG